MRLLPLTFALILLSGCGLGNGGSATMLPGYDCLRCHSAGGKASNKPFTAAGTIYGGPTAGHGDGLAGVAVTLTDALGATVTLQTNSVGNFFTDATLSFPIKAAVRLGARSAAMVSAAAAGGCSSCHNQPPQNSAPGRTYLSP